MAFDPHIACVRFGLGLSPRHGLPADTDALLADLTGPDDVAALHPIAPFAQARPAPIQFTEAFQAQRRARGTLALPLAEARIKSLKQNGNAKRVRYALRSFARGLDTPIGFRERLVAFWADHFTVKARRSHTRHYISPYIEEAIRPHIAGRFGDMLQAVETHPMMLHYLQQVNSVGPNSPFGIRKERGLNENLARELLELHTVGVDGGYVQADVTELAQLLSGLTYTPQNGMFFDPNRAEPGAETVMGTTYPAAASGDVITGALDDLATHPATARHLARKLAAHFVADDPDPDLVDAIARAYRASDGDLMACYRAMLAHPAAFDPAPGKVRPPVDFIVATLRALGVEGDAVTGLSQKSIRNLIERPLQVMGQPWQDPGGPDGWPDRAEDWIIPQTMAGRISWAMVAPARFRDPLPDPRDVVTDAFGPDAPGPVVFAARAAETRREGLGIIFASAAFQRR